MAHNQDQAPYSGEGLAIIDPGEPNSRSFTTWKDNWNNSMQLLLWKESGYHSNRIIQGFSLRDAAGLKNEYYRYHRDVSPHFSGVLGERPLILVNR
jgi:hypothetical protein